MTTHAPLRSQRTKAISVCHVQVLGDGDSPTSSTKDTRLLGVGSTALFGAVYRLQFRSTRHVVEPVYSRRLSGATTSSV